MPRLPTKLFNRARNLDPLLPLLLRPCRELPSAKNELRWIRKHVRNARRQQQKTAKRTQLSHLCHERSLGLPLQYILGSQPFGELDIVCKPGVLIPRPETETYTNYLADQLEKGIPSTTADLRVLDLCSGTGCVSLLLYHRLASRFRELKVHGLDVEPRAIKLARENLISNIELGHLAPQARHSVLFEAFDVLGGPNGKRYVLQPPWDILVSNPPYISDRGFDSETSRSTRNYEPHLALKADYPRTESIVPQGLRSSNGDRFYLPLLKWASYVESHVAIFEVGDMAQACRVLLHMASDAPECLQRWVKVEIWRDQLEPSDVKPEQAELSTVDDTPDSVLSNVAVNGVGHARALVFMTKQSQTWLRRS